ncbi:hypothetical protein JTB14_012595 [Gonioctena quinquepunctata]|nr:hypothetical protein JTB14_012595 [Gonioctena quinquepunctata]
MVDLAPRSRSLLGVNFLGFDSIIDTAAKQSIAGPSSYKISQETNHTFTSKTVFIKLADGCSKVGYILPTEVDVSLQGRIIPTTFVINPGAKNYTLIGIDFMIDAKIQLNIADRAWSFADDKAEYYLEFEPEAPTRNLHVTSFKISHAEEDQRFQNQHFDSSVDRMIKRY